MSAVLGKLFKGSSPSKLVESAVKHLSRLKSDSDASEREREQSRDKLTEIMAALHMLLYGDPDKEPKSDDIKTVVPLLLENNLCEELVLQMNELSFEAKKQASSIINFVVRRSAKNSMPDWLNSHASVLVALLRGFSDANLAQHCGSILKEISKRPELAPAMFSFQIDGVVATSSAAAGAGSAAAAAVPASSDATSAMSSAMDAAATSINQIPVICVLSSSRTMLKSAYLSAVAKSADEEEVKVSLSLPPVDTRSGGGGGGGSSTSSSAGSSAIDTRPTASSAVDVPSSVSSGLSSSVSGEVISEIVASDCVSGLFAFAHDADLIVASDAVEVLQCLLTKHKRMSRDYIESHLSTVLTLINGLVLSDNYVTQGKFLKLLADILLAKANSKVRLHYVSEKDNLRIIMTLLRSEAKLIAHEAFHIFKVFVANPNKSRDVHIILWKNRDKLLKFFADFQTDREASDADFKTEKETVLEKLNEMQMPEEVAAAIAEIREAEAAAEGEGAPETAE